LAIAGMSNRTRWDGREPITDALARCGVRDAFQAAVERGDRDEAGRILSDIGADEETAWEMVAVLIPDESSDSPPEHA
jgi:hypothetical protein